MRLIKKIKQIDRHRNGVGGAPFYAVLFTQKEEKGLTKRKERKKERKKKELINV